MSEAQSAPLTPTLSEIQRTLATVEDPLALLAGFFAYAPVAFQVYASDGHCLLVNSAFQNLFGSVPPPEYNVLEDEIAAAAGVLQLIRRSFAGEVVQTPAVWYDPRDLRQVHVPSGNRVAIEATFFPLLDMQGKANHVAIAFRDVTMQQTAAEGARLEQERLQFLADASAALGSSLDYRATIGEAARLTVPRFADLCTVDVTEDGWLQRVAVAHADPARQVELQGLAAAYRPGWDADQAVGQVVRSGERLIALAPPAGIATAYGDGGQQLAIAGAADRTSLMVMPLVARGTTLGAISFVYGPSERHYDPLDLPLAEEVARRVANAIDNAQLYRQAQDAVRARDEFLSIASHELRNPVAGISGAAQLVRRMRERGTVDPERTERYLETIERTAAHLATLTDDLLDVARLQQGRVALRSQSMDLASLVRDVVAQQLAFRLSPPITLDLECDPCVIAADPDRIEQVIANLLDNAAKYSPRGDPVDVRLAADADGVLLTVRDNGIGLPAGAAERIFEPFGRAPNAAEQNIPGLGLGLSIARRIAEQHGGRLWAESAGEGQGTTFRLWLKS